MKFNLNLKWSTWSTKKKVLVILVGIALIAYYFCLPRTLFDAPYSTVIESKDHQLLAAQIAPDGQWRFPEMQAVPDKFKTCITLYEDEYFQYHWGFNPVSMVKAFMSNLSSNKIKRGGSTLTQQTIRLARDGQKRTYFEKIIELIQATRLEFKYSKQSILNLYASHAPFGGNVVGLDVAAWRYFGTAPEQLSWAESATLAVLPNAPRLIYPGKNQEILLNKRNALLKKLLEANKIDQSTYELALTEPLPQKPHELPQIAPHLLQYVAKTNKEERLVTTIDYQVQQRANDIIANYYLHYRQAEVYNIAALIVDVENRDVIAYIGNSPTTVTHQKDVDIIQANRSTGSILKPFLYAAMLDDASLLPHQLVADIPVVISGYKPTNFSNSYEGATTANEALSRSLNIPFVLMLQQYGVYRFYDNLQQLQLSSINKYPDHYGLSLILGGAESSLWQLTRAYAGLVGTVNHYNTAHEYRTKEIQELNWKADYTQTYGESSKEKTIWGAGAIYNTFEALTKVNRPEGDEAWQYYDSALKIAWKTGTSFGGRDAWAIGVNKKYVVSVWVGNATGEGRPSISGVRMAGPILFDLFKLLPKQKDMTAPLNDLEEVSICSTSGYLAGPNCPQTKTDLAPFRAKKTVLCPYHKLVHLDASLQYQINSQCEAVDQIVPTPWFILPPTMAYFYRKSHSDYQDLPPFRADCGPQDQLKKIEFIYPKHGEHIYLTKNFYAELQPFVAKASTSSANKTLFWYLNEEYIGSTRQFHELAIHGKTGINYLTITDEEGHTQTIEFYLEKQS
ncbi:penicillin-binding protein 1C [Myroides odoratus]|uniref:peptidoglycan glycosyltransferase n=1 Tax=Myroides odoratus TaxID=256 RepID=A0A378U3C8_MYROD|nr:penicillin-binding protein 1C [Myroides odoratus]QQU02979.1 penicillin-binding protein 1C [Myroides odoratus]STZ69785.1 Penicillin-binding protein 4 precursor [Myroides odoratus]